MLSFLECTFIILHKGKNQETNNEIGLFNLVINLKFQNDEVI